MAKKGPRASREPIFSVFTPDEIAGKVPLGEITLTTGRDIIWFTVLSAIADGKGMSREKMRERALFALRSAMIGKKGEG
jgi:hypothetical protein